MTRYLSVYPLISLVLAFFIINNAAGAGSVSGGVQFSPQEQRMLSWIESQQSSILQDLQTHIDINTGTQNVAGLDRYRALLASELKALGFITEEIRNPTIETLSCSGETLDFAKHLLAKKTGKSAQSILLNGHMDTVFPVTDSFQTLQIDPDGTLKGPGVADMKGGIVIMLYALKALEQAGELKDADIGVLLNSDEEMGSLSSRPALNSIASEYDIGLVFESTFENQMIEARKGLGQARIRVTGRESHSGAAHAKGVSANLELAHKIIDIEKLTSYEDGVTVNVGVMSGGEKRNTVPGCADAYIDMRYPNRAAGVALEKSLKSIGEKRYLSRATHPGFPASEFWSVLHRPSKPLTPKIDQLLDMVEDISVGLDDPLGSRSFSGGGTDGSILQAAGLPTIDTLGVDGSGIHSSREQTSIESLMVRTKLAAVLMYRLLNPSKN